MSGSECHGSYTRVQLTFPFSCLARKGASLLSLSEFSGSQSFDAQMKVLGSLRFG